LDERQYAFCAALELPRGGLLIISINGVEATIADRAAIVLEGYPPRLACWFITGRLVFPYAHIEIDARIPSAPQLQGGAKTANVKKQGP
jgi:hypothetical protein